MFKVLHTSDSHFSNKVDKLNEAVTTTNAIVTHAERCPPDVVVLAGDTVDEHDGPIRIDSDAARAAISYVTRLADICPVVIIRGTRSHDRESPYLFSHLKSRCPIYVANQIGMVGLFGKGADARFIPLDSAEGTVDAEAVFSLIPSPDKSNIITAFGADSKQSGTLIAKEALHDVLALLGSINAEIPYTVPRIGVLHGMITGAVYSSGTIATGEDFEFSLSDLAQMNTDLNCCGHVHKYQSFPGGTHYSGSPGRMNMGEQELKGFLTHTFQQRQVITTFTDTPARYFVMQEYDWITGYDLGEVHGGVKTGKNGFDIAVEAALIQIEMHPGCDVRFRFTVPEEERHVPESRQLLEEKFTKAGARSVKVEAKILPTFRQRAAGISHQEKLRDKIVTYGAATGTTIPERTLEIADRIEGMEVGELVEWAKKSCGEAV